MMRKLNDYENRIAQLSQEIERLNGVLRSKVNENESLKTELKNYELRVSSEYQSKITTFESRIRQFTGEKEDLARKLSEYENRIALMSQ